MSLKKGHKPAMYNITCLIYRLTFHMQITAYIYLEFIQSIQNVFSYRI